MENNKFSEKEITVSERYKEVMEKRLHLMKVTGIDTVSDFNRRVEADTAKDIINVTEVLQARQIAAMADDIKARGTIRTVLIAGPSSSGKTTFSKRLSIQLMAVGLEPVTLSTDDYFVDRHLTPKDEAGHYDFESLYAVDLDFFNHQLQALTQGQEVELPRFNFETGLREFRGEKLRCSRETVLVIEGIHALNPLLTESLPDDAKYRIFCSVLSEVNLDGELIISSSDNRLLRRILRDSQYRGFPAEDTIRRWPSVRRGEEKWIFPFMHLADIFFDSSFIYELAVMKEKLSTILLQAKEREQQAADSEQIEPTIERLLTYIGYFHAIPDQAIPPTSLLREFFGGSSYHY